MTTHNPFPIGQPGFISHPIERAAYLRTDPSKLDALRNHRDTRVYVLQRDSIALAKDTNGQRAALTLDEAKQFGSFGEAVFLGLDHGAARFGAAIDAAAAEALANRSDVSVENLRAVIASGTVAPNELSTIAMAKSLTGWHQRHRFCANCGTPTLIAEGGWKRACLSCKAEHFPRTDPVVIMLVTHGDNCLLGRQPQYIPGMWSCLAGFVEVAETIENAVMREVFEESRVVCTDVRYYMAQPWPYPSSLMVGCTARATTTEITVDRNELEDARWFSRDEVRTMMNKTHPGGLIGPNPVAIAHHLLGRWLQETATANS